MKKFSATQFWLMKSEPETFSIQDLLARPKQTEPWNGVRNYQARNFMKDVMRQGDLAFFYHSSCEVPAIVGLMEIASNKAYPDETSWDKKSPYFDPKSSPENPRWFMVDVKLKEIFPEMIPLSTLRKIPELKDMQLLKRGQRLSIQPVTTEEFNTILNYAKVHL